MEDDVAPRGTPIWMDAKFEILEPTFVTMLCYKKTIFQVGTI